MKTNHIAPKKLDNIKHVVLDMDGTIYSGKNLFATTIPFLELLDSRKIGYSFLTNNSSRSVMEYKRKLTGLGIPSEKIDVFTSTLSVIQWLKEEHPGIRKLYVIGTDSFRNELKDAGFTITFGEPDAVVVGFDTALEYNRLCKAAYWVSKGKLWLASHPDAVCPTDEELVLVDCGAVTDCLSSALGRVPDIVLGKPSPEMLNPIIAKYKLKPHEILMVGDRLNTDMELAKNAGTNGILIACNAPEKLENDAIICSVQDLGELGRLMSCSL